jgi:hypothetical protein
MWVVLLLFGTAAAAQVVQSSQKTEPQEQKLFILKYAQPDQVISLLRVFTSQIQTNEEMHALAISAPASTMNAIEEAIKKLDVPGAQPKNIDMTAYLLVAGDSATPAGTPIPKEIASVETQLKNTFPFKNYGLLDVITFRTRTGQDVNMTSSGGSFQIGGRQVAVLNTLQIRSINIESDGSTIHLERLRSGYKVPVSTGTGDQYSYSDLGINTNLDIKEGQKVVVGRVGISHDQALFLVLTAKVI